jgi:hypothetical protein
MCCWFRGGWSEGTKGVCIVQWTLNVSMYAQVRFWTFHRVVFVLQLCALAMLCRVDSRSADGLNIVC